MLPAQSLLFIAANIHIGLQTLSEYQQKRLLLATGVSENTMKGAIHII
jgi:hypothetical protein